MAFKFYNKKQSFVFYFILFLATSSIISQNKKYDVTTFNKVIISPHIEAIFIQGDKEAVEIEMLKAPIHALQIEVKNKTLKMYLEDAKIYTKQKKAEHSKDKNYPKKIPAYKGTVVKAIIYYKTVKKFSLRGAEQFLFKGTMQSNKTAFTIYGTSNVIIENAILEELKTTIYGESYFKIESGSIKHQKIIGYGASTTNFINVNNATSKITAYGDGSYTCNVSDALKITSYGAPKIIYKGAALVNKGITIGEVEIVHLD